MRELKFRVWNKRYSEYIRPDYNIIGYIYPLDGTLGVSSGDQDGHIIEQYTGLKDKNGKDIYEGDVLGGIWEGGYIGYCEKCKQFQYCSCGECMACSGDVHWYEIVEDDGELEVIGNIHENPELLGEEEE